MGEMKKMLAAMVALCGALCACAAGFDGKNLVTNDWFDASFTSLEVDTVIVTNTTTGITSGAGMWTEAPTNGTATIVADTDAGGGATCLSLNAPGELLKFTPAPFSVTSGMETVVAEFKADAIDSLPDLPETAQGGFTVYMDANDVLSAKGWTSTGWTTLSSAQVDSLTNQWVTVYLDFATVNDVRYVRYSVKPAAGALSVLSDANGDSWFQARTNATTVSAVAFSGVANCRTISGDSLEEVMVATYNGGSYATVAAAIAAGEADSWANGKVVLLANATWAPIAAGTYNIDVASFTLDATETEYTLTTDTTAGAVTATRIYTWAGSVDTWLSAANWTVGNDAHVATTYPGEVVTEPFTVVFAKNATFTSAETVDISGRTMNVEADGFSVKLPNLTVTPGEDNNPATTTRLVSGTFRCSNYNRHRVMVEDGATLIIDQNVSGSSTYYNWFKGTGAIVVDGVTINATQGYGSVVRGFNGTFKLANDAKLITTSNNSDTFIGTGKFVFAGGTVQKDATYGTTNHAFGSSAIDVVAATVNNCDMTVPLNKVTVVSGTAILDTGVQYVVLTARTSTTGVLPDNAVDATLEAANWAVLQSTNATGQTILVLTHSPTYTWTGAAGDGLWATPENWIVGDYVPVAAPGEGDTVSVETEAETLEVVVTDGQNVGTLTKGENVSLVGPGPYVATVTAGVVSLERVPSTFVWTNSGVSNWETLDNWTVNGRPTDVLPGGLDEVRFPSTLGNTAFVKYSSSQVVSNAVFDAEVTLRIVGTRHDYYLYAFEIGGEGKLTLTNAAIGARGEVSGDGKSNYQTNLVVNVDLEMAPCSTNRLFCHVGNIILNGGMSGSGSVEGYAWKQSFGPEFHGNNEGFKGEYWAAVNTGARRDFTQFADGGATSSNATWRFVGSDGNKALFGKNNETYYFGTLNGIVDNSNSSGSGYVNGCWAEVGALNCDCSFGGHYSRGYKSASEPYINHIRKVGTAKLTLTLSRPVGDIEIKGGTLDIGSKNSVPLYYTETKQHYLKFLGKGATLVVSGTETVDETIIFVDPSARIAYSTAPICFSNAVNEVHTWATALVAQVADAETGKDAGLVKLGEGTLVLSAAPLYTGDTYLDGGVLKIPASANKTVKTHLPGMLVKRTVETIGGIQYSVYTLDKVRAMVILF